MLKINKYYIPIPWLNPSVPDFLQFQRPRCRDVRHEWVNVIYQTGSYIGYHNCVLQLIIRIKFMYVVYTESYKPSNDTSEIFPMASPRCLKRLFHAVSVS